MKESKKGRIRNVLDVTRQFSSHHTSAYAAQAAYFFLLSLIPIIILLLTLVQFTPVTEEDVMQAVLQVFPSSVADRHACDAGLQPVGLDHPVYHTDGAVVGGKRRTLHDVRPELCI